MSDTDALHRESATARPRVLVVGWDGATWDVLRPLLAQGRLPHLARLLDRGAHGVLAHQRVRHRGEAAVRHDDALRLTCGAGGVDDVRGVVDAHRRDIGRRVLHEQGL